MSRRGQVTESGCVIVRERSANSPVCQTVKEYVKQRDFALGTIAPSEAVIADKPSAGDLNTFPLPHSIGANSRWPWISFGIGKLSIHQP